MNAGNGSASPLRIPIPIPHPDDVVVNLRDGTVRVKGPMTKEDKAELERVRRRIRDSEAELAWLREELAKRPEHQLFIESIEHEEYMLALKRFIEQVLTGADPAELKRPVRPLSTAKFEAKYKARVRELAAKATLSGKVLPIASDHSVPGPTPSELAPPDHPETNERDQQ